MTDVDSWDTCVLGYMCAQSILLAKAFPSPSSLNHPVEQAGREAVWRGSASQSSLVLRPRAASPLEVCHTHSVPLRSVHLSPTPRDQCSSGRMLRVGQQCRMTTGASVLRSLCSIPRRGRSYIPKALDPFHLTWLQRAVCPPVEQ